MNWRHNSLLKILGFFSCFLFLASFYMLIGALVGWGAMSDKEDKIMIAGLVAFPLLLPALILVVVATLRRKNLDILDKSFFVVSVIGILLYLLSSFFYIVVANRPVS